MSRNRPPPPIAPPSDPIERALRDAVLEAPRDDDGPRLAYADWLLERGDPRGELIVAQCTRARLEASGDRTSDVHRRAWRRERKLIRTHIDAWFGPYGSTRHFSGTLVRGFLGELAIAPHKLRERWPVFQHEPLETLRLTMPKHPVTVEDLRWIAAQPELRALRQLEIVHELGTISFDAARLWPLLVSDVDATGDAVDAPRLRWREAITGFVYSEGYEARPAPMPSIAAIARSLPATVRGLGVYRRDLVDADVAPLLAGRSLEDLSLSTLEASGVAELARARQPALRTLWLTTASEGLDAPLADSAVLATVDVLRSSNASPELVRSLASRRLRGLSLYGRRPRAVLAPLLAGTVVHDLEQLCLGLDVDAATLLEGTAFRTLGRLDLDWSKLGNAGARVLAAMPELATLAELSLQGCEIRDPGAMALLEAPFLDELVELDVRDNPIGDRTAARLVERWPDALVRVRRGSG
ncbi:MAG TPA: TIGR02996 domain-containing protein [Kofleriaceae bacterium]|nr:TIGR02996 domain-containing protein [Kofleriaceae bacterium]